MKLGKMGYAVVSVVALCFFIGLFKTVFLHDASANFFINNSGQQTPAEVLK